MSKKLTLEEVNEKLKLKNIYITEYIDAHTNVIATCKICGNQWSVKPYSLLHLSGCPVCNHKAAGKKISTTKDEFLRLYSKGNIDIMDDWNGTKQKYVFKCKKCGFEWKTTPDSFRSYGSCPKCNNIQLKYSHEEYCELVKKVHGDDYKILNEFTSMTKKIKIKHITCGTIFETNAQNFIGSKNKKASGCPLCGKIKNINDCKQRAKDLNYKEHILQNNFLKYLKIFSNKKNNHFKIISNYTNARKLKFQCTRCNYVIEKNKYAALTNELLCPVCDKDRYYMSKGERLIFDYLKLNNYSFQKEYRIKECKDKNSLPFDFAVFENDKLKYLIEYDGIQHFKYVNSGIYTKENFKNCQRHDQIKNEYCKNNNINLLRISYKEKNKIIEILDNFFKERSTTISNESKTDNKPV